jgi:hypothetical protein
VPVQPALYRYAECVPTRHRLPNPQALFVQVGMPEEVPIAPPSQGGMPSSSDDRSGFDTCWDPNIDKGMKDKGDTLLVVGTSVHGSLLPQPDMLQCPGGDRDGRHGSVRRLVRCGVHAALPGPPLTIGSLCRDAGG